LFDDIIEVDKREIHVDRGPKYPFSFDFAQLSVIKVA
jgi:hypothetical protein